MINFSSVDPVGNRSYAAESVCGPKIGSFLLLAKIRVLAVINDFSRVLKIGMTHKPGLCYLRNNLELRVKLEILGLYT